jgi:hypothetical protein
MELGNSETLSQKLCINENQKTEALLIKILGM